MDNERKDVTIHIEGTEEVSHGIGKLALYLIPLAVVLAVGAIVSVMVSIIKAPSEISFSSVMANHEINQIKRQESAQSRADNRVGAESLPTSPVKLIMVSTGPCVKLESGYLDNGDFTGYVKNNCHQDATYYELYLSGIAPDGTIIQSSYNNSAYLPEIGAMEKAEIHAAVYPYGGSLDARVVTIRAKLVGRD